MMSHLTSTSQGTSPILSQRSTQSLHARTPAQALPTHRCAAACTSSHLTRLASRRSMAGTAFSGRAQGLQSGRQPPQTQQARRAGAGVVRAARDVDIADRAVAAVPYLVPLFDGLKYGRFLFAQFPAFARLLAPLNPLISLYFSFPFASLIVFFAIYAGIVNNQSFSRYVRFNALQSILLDIILIIPGLIEQVLRPPMGGPFLTIYIQLYNAIFFFVFASVVYAVGSCLFGETPRVPLVANAADQQVR